MSINAIGTLLRVIGVFFSLMLFWYVSILAIYFVIASILNITFLLSDTFILFGIFILIRMFYPKNVFV